MRNLLFLILSLSLFACSNDDDSGSSTPANNLFAVANRGAATVTVFDATTQSLVSTINLPTGSEPTYVVQSPEHKYLYVSDFKTQKVNVYNSETNAFVKDFAIQDGGFHMWVNDVVDQLWVNNIKSKTTTVLNSSTGANLATISIPTDKITVAGDATVHDVFIAPDGKYAYISIISQAGKNYVLQYDTSNFSFVKAQEVGVDPHISGSASKLYILSQVSNSITEYDYASFDPTGVSQTIPNAHGVAYASGNQLYVTDIAGREVYSYDAGTNKIVEKLPTKATAGLAHNLAYSTDNGTLALTISAGNTVEFYSTNSQGDLEFIKSIESGANPFGLCYFGK